MNGNGDQTTGVNDPLTQRVQDRLFYFKSKALTSLHASEQEVTPEEVLAGDSDPCDPSGAPDTSLMESVSTSSSGGSSHIEKKRWSLRSFGAAGCKLTNQKDDYHSPVKDSLKDFFKKDSFKGSFGPLH